MYFIVEHSSYICLDNNFSTVCKTSEPKRIVAMLSYTVSNTFKSLSVRSDPAIATSVGIDKSNANIYQYGYATLSSGKISQHKSKMWSINHANSGRHSVI